MRPHVSDPSGAELKRIGIPDAEIPAILAASASGKMAATFLSLITVVAIIAVAALLARVHGSLAMNSRMLRIAGQPLIFYDVHWWSAFLLLPVTLLPVVLFGIGYAVHVLIRLRPELKESVTAASLQMRTTTYAGAAGGLSEWMLRRTVDCALSKKNQNLTFLQRGNDCVRRVYGILFFIFLVPGVWCARNDLAAFNLVTPEGVEYVSWLNGENRKVEWRDLQEMRVECQSAGHGNFLLSFTIGVRSGNGTHRISFSETFQPLRKFRHDGEVAISLATREWLSNSIARFDMLSSWQQRVAGQGVTIERHDTAKCAAIVREGLMTLPLYYRPLAIVLGVGH
jgi:hypothetical protein